MRIGLSTPVVMQIPGTSSDWETGAGVDDLVRIAVAADELGFDHLTCGEHVMIPVDKAGGRGLTYWDPSATLAFLAAHTSRIRLTTFVLVLGYHHPLEIAKRYGTLDLLSGGRVVLGVGVGSLAEEFAMLGAEFDDRGARADEAITALRASWSDPRPEFEGRFYRFSGIAVEPAAATSRVPIWVGGRTLRSLRRAVTLGDGWVPFGLTATEMAEMLARFELPPGFEVVLPAGRALDPLGDPEGAAGQLIRVRDAGATVVNCSVSATSAGHFVEQLEALRHIADGIPGNRA